LTGRDTSADVAPPPESTPAHQDTATLPVDPPAVLSQEGREPSAHQEAPPRGEVPVDCLPERDITPVQAAIPPVVDIYDLDWSSIQGRLEKPAVGDRTTAIIDKMRGLLERPEGNGMLFDEYRQDREDRAICVPELDASIPLWIIGDLHGDLLALEAALALIEREAASAPERPRIIFLGDLFDDGGFGLEVLLRVLELIVSEPGRICLIAGNHDEALSFDGEKFSSSVEPCDFSEYLNAHLADERISSSGKLAIELFARMPRALFLPDGLLVAHGGFPLIDQHEKLRLSGDWNAPECLSDFVWTRAHPKVRKKLPNRYTRGSQFGYEDFAAFCRLSEDLGRPVARLVRGHDHVEERYAIYAADQPNPILTTVALSRSLPRESVGPPERVPTVAKATMGALPQVHRLHIPPDLIRDIYFPTGGEEACRPQRAEESNP
jgi:hypothetical protein